MRSVEYTLQPSSRLFSWVDQHWRRPHTKADPAHRTILCETDSDAANMLRVSWAVVKMKVLAY